jgi:hypothetical protein
MVAKLAIITIYRIFPFPLWKTDYESIGKFVIFGVVFIFSGCSPADGGVLLSGHRKKRGQVKYIGV